MSYEGLLSGIVRLTSQAYITPTSTPIKIYSVFVASSATNAAVILSDTRGSTTATNIGTDYLSVPTLDSGTTYVVGHWTDTYGMRFQNGCLVKTSAAFAFVVIQYVTEI